VTSIAVVGLVVLGVGDGALGAAIALVLHPPLMASVLNLTPAVTKTL